MKEEACLFFVFLGTVSLLRSHRHGSPPYPLTLGHAAAHGVAAVENLAGMMGIEPLYRAI